MCSASCYGVRRTLFSYSIPHVGMLLLSPVVFIEGAINTNARGDNWNFIPYLYMGEYF